MGGLLAQPFGQDGQCEVVLGGGLAQIGQGSRCSLMAASGDGHVLGGGVDKLEGCLVCSFSQGGRCNVVRHLVCLFSQGGGCYNSHLIFTFSHTYVYYSHNCSTFDSLSSCLLHYDS